MTNDVLQHHRVMTGLQNKLTLQSVTARKLAGDVIGREQVIQFNRL